MGVPIYLLRHGETVFNREGRYQGQLDSPLTPLGERQARVVAEALSERLGQTPVTILSSPLGRALRTAEILSTALPGNPMPEPDERLKEVGMGEWDGLTRAEIADRWPDARRGRSTREWMFHGPGGESLEDLATRLGDLLDEIKARPNQSWALVTHAVSGRILRALHSGEHFLDVLKQDAPQDAAFLLAPDGGIEMIATDDYRQRYAVD